MGPWRRRQGPTPVPPLASLTERLRTLLADMADGLRTGYDAGRADGWYEEAGLIGRRAPEVLEVVETGRKSTRWNLRHRVRPARID